MPEWLSSTGMEANLVFEGYSATGVESTAAVSPDAQDPLPGSNATRERRPRFDKADFSPAGWALAGGAATGPAPVFELSPLTYAARGAFAATAPAVGAAPPVPSGAGSAPKSTGAGSTAAVGGGSSAGAGAVEGPQGCQTCKSRTYQDGSDDPGVSFKSAQHIDAGSAAMAVASHEQEHVSRRRAQAEQEGREVVSQTVQIHTAICPECGRTYVSGGTTTTTTRAKSLEGASGTEG